MEIDKMIEEMAKIVDEMYNVYTTTAEDIAEGINNAGYRKIGELEFDNEIIKFNMKETEKASFNINQMNGNLVLENQVLKYRIAELEDKIENGTLVELPCKVGDDVYYIKDYGFGRKRAERMHVVGFNFGNGNKEIKVVGRYGEQALDIYFTEEAAEARLKELQEEQK